MEIPHCHARFTGSVFPGFSRIQQMKPPVLYWSRAHTVDFCTWLFQRETVGALMPNLRVLLLSGYSRSWSGYISTCGGELTDNGYNHY